MFFSTGNWVAFDETDLWSCHKIWMPFKTLSMHVFSTFNWVYNGWNLEITFEVYKRISFQQLNSEICFACPSNLQKLYPPALVIFIFYFFISLWTSSYMLLNSSILIMMSNSPDTCSVVIFPGNREREARKTSRCDSRQVQSHMELPASQGQQPSLLPWPGGSQELLLLQGCPQGWIHCRQPLHAREFCHKRLPRSSSGGRHPDESQLLQHRKQALTLMFISLCILVLEFTDFCAAWVLSSSVDFLLGSLL